MPVINLKDDSTFNAKMKKILKITKNKSIPYIVLVSSPHCGHCISLQKAWKAAADIIKKKKWIIQINADVAAHLLSEHSDNPLLKKLLKGYGNGVPFISKFSNNAISEFNGERNIEELVGFMSI